MKKKEKKDTEINTKSQVCHTLESIPSCRCALPSLGMSGKAYIWSLIKFPHLLGLPLLLEC